MSLENLCAIAVLALTLYAVRVLPLTLIRKEIRNKYIRSFLYYVPYVTLTVMTFPAVLSATKSMISAGAGFVVAVWMAYCGRSLFQVAIGGCVTVFLVELFPFI